MKQTLSLVAIRFTFLLCSFFILCFNNSAYYFLDWFGRYLNPLKETAVIWTAKNILHLPQSPDTAVNGSGDTTYSFVLLLVVFLLTLTGTIIWSAVDRKRAGHQQLFYWLTVLLRFYVGFMLVHYGLAKLNNGQFPGPSAMGMLTTYGDSSPMGLAWRFLGFSEGYKTFMFFAEMMGVLLFFRKTATLGALLSLMTCLNIMAINYFFDVPVKLISTALVVMCLIILSPNLLNLFRLFFKGAEVKLDQLRSPVFADRSMRIGKTVLKYLGIVFCAGIPTISTLWTTVSQQHDPKTDLYGVYEISSLEWADGTAPESTFLTGKEWATLGFDSYDRAFLGYPDHQIIYAKSQFETGKKTIKLSFNDDPGVRYTFSYWEPLPDQLELKGQLFGEHVTINLKKKDFELTRQGFRWINEYPYNR